MAGRTLGNNSLWSVEEAEAHLREALARLEGALGSATMASARGLALQDLAVVTAASDVRVELVEARSGLREALGYLADAKEGKWRGRDRTES